MHAIIIRGMPGAGKTTEAEKLAQEGYVIISRDALRLQLGVDPHRVPVLPPDVEEEVQGLAMALLLSCVRLGRNVVVEGPYASLERLLGMRNALRDLGYAVEVRTLTTDPELCYARRVCKGFPEDIFGQLLLGWWEGDGNALD